MNVFELIIKELIKKGAKTAADLSLLKREVAKKYKIPYPSNIELLKAYHKLIKNKTPYSNPEVQQVDYGAGKLYTGQGIKKMQQIEALLRTRPVRSLSGIVNVSVLTKPYPCPGKCLYCPIEKGIPKSYVSGEPAVERAKRLNYNPYLQVKKRIEMLRLEGHPTDKIELRIIGGTWSYYPKKYQTWFITRCFAACNAKLARNISAKPTRKIKSLKEEQKINERAKHRMVGLSIETRPDFINVEEIKWLRRLGVTMVELGVQSIYDDVLKKNLRGHGVKETVLATKLLKDAGFKVLYQMMPNLPGSNLKKDEKMFEELFKNPDFQPDYLKIYPCALLKEAPLYKLWQKRQYKPYAEKRLINLIKEIKKKIPYYVRIQRITRDIPSFRVVAGPAKISNLRQILLEKMKRESWQCKCIRCREVREKYNPKEKIYLFREDYGASEGKEIFLSFENKNRTKLYSLLRLRIPSFVFQLPEHQRSRKRILSSFLPSLPSEARWGKKKVYFLRPAEVGPLQIFPVLRNSAIIREIHTYGSLVPISEKKLAPQHRGLGKKLIQAAEKIIYTEFNRSAKKEFNLNEISVISAVGTRGYFRKLGYRLKNTYMVKKI